MIGVGMLRALVVGADRDFKIDWQPGQRAGKRIVSGTVQSAYGAAAWRVQLLVEGLDEKGDIANQKVVWLGIDVPPFGRAYFETCGSRAPHV